MAVYDKPVSEATLRRMPQYLHWLHKRREQGAEFISCSDIGAELNLDSTQVRKDLETAGLAGRPRVGFSVPDLICAIECFLGWNKVTEAFLAGTGNLGTALLGYDRLKNYGVHIVASFDSDQAKIGTEIYSRQVLPIEKLTGLAARMHVLIGIIAVPAAHAQNVADMMVAGGIRAIWNFAPVSLHVPEHVIVQNEEVYYSLASLSKKLADNLRLTNHPGDKTDNETDAAAPAQALRQV
jgi:redox-sensing transcriptional repressor